MCRWLVWCGSDPIPLDDLIFWPTNSLIHQSFNGGFHPECPGKNNMTLNADGFGVGWYGRCSAAVFKSTTAAWNNRNLRELARTIESTCIFAHVRAASETSVISEQNCHPFRFGRLLFQHNGHIEQFQKIKRRLNSVLRDDVYDWCEGTTDSEACFALLLSLLDPAELAHGGPIEPKLLQDAMLGTIAALRQFLADADVTTGYSTFNFALTDGQTVVVTRYCDKAPAIPAPSLYYAFAKPASLRQHLRGCPAGRLAPGHGATAMKPLTHPTAGTAGRGSSDRGGDGGGCGSGGKGGGGGGSDDGSSSRGDGGRFASTKWGNRAAFICASEPLTTEVANWHLIPDNSMLCYEAGTGLRGGSGTVSASSSTAWLPSRPPLVATAPIDPQRVSARSHRSVSPGGPLMTPVPPMPSRDLAAGIRSSATFGSRRAGSDTGWESNGPSSDATGRQGGENGDMSDGGGDDEEEGWMAALHALPLASPLCKHAVARALTKLKGAAGHVPAALGAVNGGAVNDGDNSTGRADNFVNRLGVGVNSWLAESGAALPRLEAGAREAGCSGARAEAAGAQAAAAAAADALGDALAVVVRAEAAAKADSAMAGAAAEGTSDNGVGAAAGGAPDKNIGAAAGGKPDKGIEAAALALLDTCIGADVSPSTGVEPSGSSPFGAAAKAAGLESKHMGPNGTGPVARVEASHAAQPPPPPHRSTSAPPPTPTVLPTSSSDLAFFDLEAPPQDNTAGTAAHHEETAPGAQHGALADDSQRKAGGAPYTERSCAPPHRASGIDGAAEASNGSTLPSENGASDYRGVVAADGLPQPPDAARGMSAAGAAVEHGAAAIQPLAGAHGHLLNGHHPQPESETRVPQEPPCFGAGESGAGREERHVRRTPRGDDERVSVLSLHESRLDSFLAAAAGAPPPPWRQGSLLKLWGGEGPAGGQCSPRGVAAAARHRSTAEEAPGGEPTPEERLNQMSVNSELMREVDGS